MSDAYGRHMLKSLIAVGFSRSYHRLWLVRSRIREACPIGKESHPISRLPPEEPAEGGENRGQDFAGRLLGGIVHAAAGRADNVNLPHSLFRHGGLGRLNLCTVE